MLEQLLPSVTTLGVTALLCGAGLRAWRGWLDLRRLEMGRQPVSERPTEEVGMRIELAGVKERLKKLEAIASGIEL